MNIKSAKNLLPGDRFQVTPDPRKITRFLSVPMTYIVARTTTDAGRTLVYTMSGEMLVLAALEDVTVL